MFARWPFFIFAARQFVGLVLHTLGAKIVALDRQERAGDDRTFLVKLTSEAMAKHLAHEHGRSPFADNLKEIVYGGLDGIITTFAVVAGFSGAALLGTVGMRFTPSRWCCFLVWRTCWPMGFPWAGGFPSTRSEQARWNRAGSGSARDRAQPRTGVRGNRPPARGLWPQRRGRRTVAQIYRRYPGLWADWMMRHELQMEDMSEATRPKTGWSRSSVSSSSA